MAPTGKQKSVIDEIKFNQKTPLTGPIHSSKLSTQNEQVQHTCYENFVGSSDTITHSSYLLMQIHGSSLELMVSLKFQVRLLIYYMCRTTRKAERISLGYC